VLRHQWNSVRRWTSNPRTRKITRCTAIVISRPWPAVLVRSRTMRTPISELPFFWWLTPYAAEVGKWLCKWMKATQVTSPTYLVKLSVAWLLSRVPLIVQLLISNVSYASIWFASTSGSWTFLDRAPFVGPVLSPPRTTLLQGKLYPPNIIRSIPDLTQTWTKWPWEITVAVFRNQQGKSQKFRNYITEPDKYKA